MNYIKELELYKLKEIKDLLENVLSEKDNNILFELLDKEQQDAIKKRANNIFGFFLTFG